MLGSANSISCVNIMLNSAVAESLKVYADELEKAKNFESALHDLIKNTIKKHKRILFNGNGYDDAWIVEAEKRGLCNYRTTPDCMPHLLDKKNVDMLTGHKVFTQTELKSRCEIMLDNYCKTVVIEANTMSDMTRKQIIPAIEKYIGDICQTAVAKKQFAPDASFEYEMFIVRKLSALCSQINLSCKELYL